MRNNTVVKRSLTRGMALIVTLTMGLLLAAKSSYALTRSAPQNGVLIALFQDTGGDLGTIEFDWQGFNPTAPFGGVSDLTVTLTLFDTSGNPTEVLTGVGVDVPFAVLLDGEGVHDIYFVLFDPVGNEFFHSGSYVTDPTFTSGGGAGIAHGLGQGTSFIRWVIDFPI